MKTGELIVLAVVILIVFSASRMGALGNALGRFVHSFRRAAKGSNTIDVTPRRVGRQEDVADAEFTPASKKDPRT